jgi:hypothetical protein
MDVRDIPIDAYKGTLYAYVITDLIQSKRKTKRIRSNCLNMKRKRARTVKSNIVHPFLVTSAGHIVSDMEIETIMLVDAGFQFQ